MPNASINKTTQEISTAAELPARERALLDELRDPTITWRSSRSQDHQTWESGGEMDPFRPRNKDFEHSTGITRSGRAIGGRRVAGGIDQHRQIDWHSVETETLRATTGAHEIRFSKTRVNSYSHQLRKGVDVTQYEAQFVSVHDKNQRVELKESSGVDLARLFADIARGIN